MLNILFLLLTIISLGCTTNHTKSNSKKNQINQASISNKINITKTPIHDSKLINDKHNIDQLIMKTLPIGWEKKNQFQIIDNKNGYARANGYYEGFTEYFLFVGVNKNLLVEVMWGCGPACEQVIKFYEFSNLNNTPYKQINFKKISSINLKDKLNAYIEICNEDLTFNSWANKNCYMMFDFQKKGTNAKVYNASIFENGYFQDKYGNQGVKLATLTWNRKLFQFELKE